MIFFCFCFLAFAGYTIRAAREMNEVVVFFLTLLRLHHQGC